MSCDYRFPYLNSESLNYNGSVQERFFKGIRFTVPKIPCLNYIQNAFRTHGHGQIPFYAKKVCSEKWLDDYKVVNCFLEYLIAWNKTVLNKRQIKSEYPFVIMDELTEIAARHNITSSDFKTVFESVPSLDKKSPDLCNNLELRLIFIALCNERLNQCLSMKKK